MSEWTADKLPRDWLDVLSAFGLGWYAIDLSDVSLEDSIALVEFCRERNAERMKPERPGSAQQKENSMAMQKPKGKGKGGKGKGKCPPQ